MTEIEAKIAGIITGVVISVLMIGIVLLFEKLSQHLLADRERRKSGD